MSFGLFIETMYPKIFGEKEYKRIIRKVSETEEEFLDRVSEFIIATSIKLKKILIFSKEANNEMVISEKQQEEFDAPTQCYLCDVDFTEETGKHRDHDHLKSVNNYLGAACMKCNIQRSAKNMIPSIWFHNGKGFDFHPLISSISKKYNITNAVAQTNEKYMGFTVGKKQEWVDKTGKNREKIEPILKFRDSLAHMSMGLETLAGLLKKEDFINLKKESNKRGYTGNQFIALTRKGIYPYNWVNNLEKMNETKLPPRQDFFNDLSGSQCDYNKYLWAQHVWKLFDCKTFKDYHDIYLFADA